MKCGEIMEDTNKVENENTSNVERPKESFSQTLIGPLEMRLFGRKIIYADYDSNTSSIDIGII